MPLVTVLLVFWVNTMIFQVSRFCSKLHVNPTMSMAFSKIVTNCRLVNKMKMVQPIMLPFMRVAIEIGSCMLSFGKQFQERRSIDHALNGTHPPIGIRVEVTKNKGGLMGPLIEFLGKPVQLFLPQDSLSSRIQ